MVDISRAHSDREGVCRFLLFFSSVQTVLARPRWRAKRFRARRVGGQLYHKKKPQAQPLLTWKSWLKGPNRKRVFPASKWESAVRPFPPTHNRERALRHTTVRHHRNRPVCRADVAQFYTSVVSRPLHPTQGYSFCLLQASRGGHGVQCSPSGRIGARATVWAQELERYL